MAKTWLAPSNNNSFRTSQSATIYYQFGQGALNGDGTESVEQNKFEVAGTSSFLTMHVIAGVGTFTLQARKNTANGNQSVGVGSGAGYYSDSSNTDAIAVGDIFNYSTSPNGNGFTFHNPACIFDATTNTDIVYIGLCTPTTTSNETDYMPFSQNGGATDTSETNSKLKIKTAGTAKKLFTQTRTYTRSGNGTFRLRKNGANGNQNVTVNTQALQEDTSNTDSIAVNDLVNYSITNSTGSGTHAGWCGMTYETTDSTTVMQAAVNVGDSVSSAATVAYPIFTFIQGTESPDSQTELNFTASASKLIIYITANTIAATSNAHFRINEANGNNTAAITSSTTGYFEDTTNSDSISTSSRLNHNLVVGTSAAHALTVNSFAIVMTGTLPALTISVSDSVTITESTTVNDILTINVNDSVTISENFGANEFLLINSNDSISVSEFVTAAVPNLGKIIVNDLVTIIENFVGNEFLYVNVNDSITVSETIALDYILTIVISDFITISESASTAIPNLGNININDSVTISENFGANEFLYISVSESVINVEDEVILLNLADLHIQDNVTVAESVKVDINLQVSVNDSVTISESVTKDLFYNIMANDSITVSEGVTGFLVFNLSFKPVAVGTEIYNSIPTSRSYN